ncbi:MAG: FHA domain-containing protein, partial [Dehalococcoidales bacterium]
IINWLSYCQFMIAGLAKLELTRWRIYMPRAGGQTEIIRQFAKIVDDIISSGRPARTPAAVPVVEKVPEAVPFVREVPVVPITARKAAAPTVAPTEPATVIMRTPTAKVVLPDNSEIPITEKAKTLGREDFGDRIPQELLRFISRQHLIVGLEDRKYYATDTHSSNGSKINKVTMKNNEKYELKDGDLIVLGEVLTLVFRNGDTPSQAPVNIKSSVKKEEIVSETEPQVLSEDNVGTSQESSAAATPAAPPKPSLAAQVSLLREEKKGESRYYIYQGPGREAALEFLNSLKPITEFYVYHIVETPEGNFGRDKDGVYQEKT